MSQNSSSTTFLAIGDVHGHWDNVIEAIESATAIVGHSPDLVLQVGDAEPYRNEEDMNSSHVPEKYRSLGVFSLLEPGDVRAPVYFIGGNHEPYEMLDKGWGPYPIEWGPGVHYLGRAGAREMDNGLRIAWLSGISPPEVLEKRNPGKKHQTYFLNEELKRAEKQTRNLGRIDVLMTHEWPAGIQDGRGHSAIRELAQRVKPKLHVCGHMHSARETTIGDTQVHCLNAVPPADKSGTRTGWWRLYEKSEEVIKCIWVGA